jgi:hypothetical protein
MISQTDPRLVAWNASLREVICSQEEVPAKEKREFWEHLRAHGVDSNNYQLTVSSKETLQSLWKVCCHHTLLDRIPNRLTIDFPPEMLKVI